MWNSLLGKRGCPHVEQQQAAARAHWQKELAKKKGALIEIQTRSKAIKPRPA